MESKKSKDILRKHKKPRPPSSSDSSSSSDSDSGSSSDSFSSSSSSKKAIRRKAKKLRTNRRLSSSSEDERIRKREKHACHKKLEAKKSHLKRKLKEAKARKRALSPGMRRRSLTPSQKMKKLAMSMAEKKHHMLVSKERMREKEREREREREKEGREKEREKLRVRERERIRSRSPKKLKSRSPTKSSRGRDIKRKSPVDKHHMSPREKLICQIRRDRSPVDRKKEIRRRHDDSRERERRDRERAEREAARNKEREEALARCQERQRERERLAREKLRREKEKEYKPDRLLPRPAEREMAIAAARASSRERSLEREPHRTHPHTHSRPREPTYERGYEREREYIQDHRMEKEERREHDREYLVLRRREVESPSSVTAHYNERPRGPEREMYTEDQKYEREHAYLSRNYISPSEEPHRREPNWERDHHEVPREREIDHTKLYPAERPAGTSREWSGREEDWRVTQKDRQWQENWPRGGEPPEKSWDSEENFRPRQQNEWEDPRMKHDTHPREEHPPTQQISRRWPQEWRGRPNEDRSAHQGPLPPFHHNPIVPHQMEYPHERTEPMPIYRRQHPPKPHVQPPHIPHPGGFHIRPHFPPKRQMTYINPNQQAPHIIPNQNIAIHVPKIISTNVLQANPLNSQTQPVNQSAASGTNQSITAIDKTIVSGPEDKGKEKQDQQLNIKETDANTGSKEAEQSTCQQISLEEPIRDDLSEISDDADEILNKDGEANKVKNEENWDSDSNEIPETTVKKDDDFSAVFDVHSFAVTEDKEDENRLDEVTTATSIENNEEAQSSSISVPEESVKSVATPTEQEVKDMSINDDILDFEEISDGELEEEATKVRNLSDALGVDWASLVEESKFKPIPIEKLTTAKQKWQPHRIILDIGISLKYAGEEFAKKMLDEATRKLNEEQEENNIDAKLEIKKDDISIIDNDLMMDMKMPVSEIKIETKENINETKNPYLHELACVQVAAIKKKHESKMLVFNACGPNSRALSARRDLKLRRQLCGLPIKEIGFQRPVNNHLRELALKAFQKTLTEVK